jgi:hypothetical protein
MAGTFGQFSTPTGPTSGGKIYAYNNLTTVPQVVAPQNVNRGSITFHNPGANAVYVGPSVVQALNTAPTSLNGQPVMSNVTLTPTTLSLGGCFLVFSSGGQITLTGECSGQMQAFASTGSGNPLTVIESNV